jgi:hypothetical protein
VNIISQMVFKLPVLVVLGCLRTTSHTSLNSLPLHVNDLEEVAGERFHITVLPSEQIHGVAKETSMVVKLERESYIIVGYSDGSLLCSLRTVDDMS